MTFHNYNGYSGSHGNRRLLSLVKEAEFKIRYVLKRKPGESLIKETETDSLKLFKRHVQREVEERGKAEKVFVEMAHQSAALDRDIPINPDATNLRLALAECGKPVSGRHTGREPVPAITADQGNQPVAYPIPNSPEEWLILFGTIDDPLYQYRLDYTMLNRYRRFRFRQLTRDSGLLARKTKLFSLKASHVLRKTNLGGLNTLSYKSPLNFPHRMLPSEFALPRSRLIEKIVLEKAMVYEHIDKRLVIDKTLITLLMDCTQILEKNGPSPVRLVSSRVKALGGILLDLFYYLLYGLNHARVDVRLVLLFPSCAPDNKENRHIFGTQAVSGEFMERFPLFKLQELFSQQCNPVGSSRETDTGLPETLLSFRQLRDSSHFHSVPFFKQHHSLCPCDTWEKFNEELFNRFYREPNSRRNLDDPFADVSRAYREQFTRLFRQLRRALGETEDTPKVAGAYSSRHICHITPVLPFDRKEKDHRLINFYRRLDTGPWDSVFHLEVEDTGGLHFRARDYTTFPPRDPKPAEPGAPVTPPDALKMTAARIMDLMIMARNEGRA